MTDTLEFVVVTLAAVSGLVVLARRYWPAGSGTRPSGPSCPSCDGGSPCEPPPATPRREAHR